MKLIMTILFSVGLTALAQGSSWTETCTSADGSIQMISGHTLNKLTVKPGHHKTRSIDLLRKSPKTIFSQRNQLSKDSYSLCRKGDSFGITHTTTKTVAHLNIVTSDGAPLFEITGGHGSNDISIPYHEYSDYVICKVVEEGEAPCPQE